MGRKALKSRCITTTNDGEQRNNYHPQHKRSSSQKKNVTHAPAGVMSLPVAGWFQANLGSEIHSLSKAALSGLLFIRNYRIVHQMLILDTESRDIDNILISPHFFGEMPAFQTGLKYDVGFVPVFLV